MGRLGPGERHDLVDGLLAERRGSPRGTGLVAQVAVDRFLREALASATRRSSTCRPRCMISTVPSPSADKSTISARQTCFCGVLPSAMRLEAMQVRRVERDGDARAHERDLARPRAKRNPWRNSPVRFYGVRPFRRTASCCGFDQALGVLILEVDGAAVAES